MADGTNMVAQVTGRIRLRTLILIRWVAIVGQIAALLGTHFIFGFTLPLEPALIVVGASIILNMAATAQRRVPARLADRDAAIYLGYDLVQLAVLLFLTGGIQNPFVLLLLAPLIISATSLSRYSTVVLTLLLIGCATLITLWHLPLPGEAGGLTLPPVYSAGVWAAVTLSAVFIAAYVRRIAEDTRRIAEAYGASQVALAREQRVSALGALAAAAAHELGTPLGTISLVAREMANEVPAGSPLAADVDLLVSQAARCRDILAELARRPEADGGEPYHLLSLPGIIELAARPHRRPEIALDTVTRPLDASDLPVARRTPELIHGLGNLLQNALQFARSKVTVTAAWSNDSVEIEIVDDGPGFPPGVLNRLGDPYVSGRARAAGHMGLGIFIATALLERTGAELQFDNAPSGGAQVVLRWPRIIFSMNAKTHDGDDAGRGASAAGTGG